MRNLVDRLRDHRELLGYGEPLLVEAAAEVERLTALLKEADDERVALKEHYPRLRADLAAARGKRDEGFRELARQHAKMTRELAAARAHLRTLQGALNTLDVHATARHPELIDIPADEWAAAFDGIDEARDYNPAALPTPPKEEP